MRKAKLICTLGPSSDSEEVIEHLILAGMNVARLNFSHGTHDDHRRRFELVRKVSARLGTPVAILQDVQGPKIRLGKFAGGEADGRDGLAGGAHHPRGARRREDHPHPGHARWSRT